MTYEEIVQDFREISKLLKCYANEGNDQEQTINLLKSQYLNKAGKNIESFINIIQAIIFIDQAQTDPMMTLLKTLITENNNPADPVTNKIWSSLTSEINKQILNVCVKDVKIFGIKPNNVFLNFYQKCTLFKIPNLYNPINLVKEVAKDDDIFSVFEPLSQTLMELNPNFSLEKQTIEYFIEKDDVDSLQNYCVMNENTFSLNQDFIPIRHRYSKLVIVNNYLSLSAFFGSIKCFKYIILNFHFNVSDPNIFYSAIIGGNTEIIHILHNSSYCNSGSAHIAMILNRRDILDWLLLNPVLNNFNSYKSSYNSWDYGSEEEFEGESESEKEKIFDIYEMNKNLKRKYIKYLVRLNFLIDTNTRTENINDEYYNYFFNSSQNDRSNCLNKQSNINIFLHYCIKYRNVQLFVIYFKLMNEKTRIEFLTNNRINNVYSSNVLEFCLFYRSYAIIDYLLSFYPFTKSGKSIQSDFVLSKLYSDNQFQNEYLLQSKIAAKSHFNDVNDFLGIGNSFVKNKSRFYKLPTNKNIGYFPRLINEFDHNWRILGINDRNIDTGKIFKAESKHRQVRILKPIVYLYPNEVNEKGFARIEVKVEPINKQFSCTYPIIGEDGKWIVNAKLDGTLLNEADNQEYQSLYWESSTSRRFEEEFKKGGIIVEREDTISFLENVLPKLGLNIKEKNEFIQFWLPIMLRNNTNYVRFLSEKAFSTKISKLEINPKPETTIRVYMIFKQLTEDENHIPKQDLSKLFKERSGYTCVEWGGSFI